MKKIIYSSIGILAITLMSFTADKSTTNNLQAVFEISGNEIHLTDSDAITPNDLAVLSKLVLGWSECSKQSTTNQCNVNWRNFPIIDAQRATVEAIIAKYPVEYK
jgi:hypothetical protein